MTKSQVRNLGPGISLFCHSERMRGILNYIVSKISPFEMAEGTVEMKEVMMKKTEELFALSPVKPWDQVGTMRPYSATYYRY